MCVEGKEVGCSRSERASGARQAQCLSPPEQFSERPIIKTGKYVYTCIESETDGYCKCV